MKTRTAYVLSIVALLLLLAFWIWSERQKEVAAEKFNDFVKSALSTNGTGPLDLRPFEAISWDEIAYWPPYGRLCDLGITEYPKEREDCPTSHDDSEAYLVFLKHNSLVLAVPIDRTKIKIDGARFHRLHRKEALIPLL